MAFDGLSSQLSMKPSTYRTRFYGIADIEARRISQIF